MNCPECNVALSICLKWNFVKGLIKDENGEEETATEEVASSTSTLSVRLLELFKMVHNPAQQHSVDTDECLLKWHRFLQDSSEVSVNLEHRIILNSSFPLR